MLSNDHIKKFNIEKTRKYYICKASRKLNAYQPTNRGTVV